LTPQDTKDSERPVSALSAEAGAPEEIEIAPAMIDAGASVLYESGAIEHPMEDFDRNLVRKIFLAMVLVERSQS
jgi:hypothetical protein